MNSLSRSNVWLPLWTPAPGARIRLFCFPYAGGGASGYRTWSNAFGPNVEVCAVEYPGRWSRHREAPIKDLPKLVNELLEGIGGLLERPSVFFGYSFGTLVAFELARAARKRGLRVPKHLIVAARQAPQLPSKLRDIHNLPDPQFLDEVDRRYGVLPAVVRQDPDLLKMFLPVLRADITAFENYVFKDESPLDCPVTALCGVEDTLMDDAGVSAWGTHTSQDFARHRVPGGHFFINTSAEKVLQIVREAVESTHSTPVSSAV